MAYATYEDYFYWLSGRKELIVSEEFDYWESRAVAQIHLLTLGRLSNPDTLEKHLVVVKNATCRLAEAMYKHESSNSLDASKIASEKVSGYTVTYKAEPSRDKEDVYREVVRSELALTGLLYSGIRRGGT